MTVLVNSFEGGTNSTTITTGNSGGASGNAFDVVNVPTGSTNAFSNAEAAHGLLSCELATNSTAGNPYVTWSTSMGTQTQVWFRLYLYFPAFPPASQRVFEALQGTTACGGVIISTVGRIETVNEAGSLQTTSVNSIPLNQWFRIEGFIVGDPSVGQVQVILYESMDSIVPTEVNTTPATLNTTGTMTVYRFGHGAGATIANLSWYQDDIGLSSAGYLGPSNTAIVYPRQEPVQAKGNGLPPRGRIGSNPGVLVPVLLTNSFEGGTNGVTISTSNSGGVSGAAFGGVSVGSGATLVFSNAEYAHGSLSAEFSTSGTAAQSYVVWDTFGQPHFANQSQFWFRFYVYLTANPPASGFTVFQAFGNSGATTAAKIEINTSGTLSGLNSLGATIFTTSSTVPLNQWFRVEGYIFGSPNAGRFSLSLFSPDDAQVPIETQAVSNTNTLGVLANFRYGIASSSANIGPIWLDDLGISNTGPLGPASFPGQASSGMPGTVTRPRPQQPIRGRVIRGQVLSSFIFPLPVKFRTGSAYTQWATADPWTQWQTGSPYLDWETEEVS